MVQLTLTRSLPTPLRTPPERFFHPILAGEQVPWEECLTYSDRARRVLPNGIVYFGSLFSNPARPPSGKVF